MSATSTPGHDRARPSLLAATRSSGLPGPPNAATPGRRRSAMSPSQSPSKVGMDSPQLYNDTAQIEVSYGSHMAAPEMAGLRRKSGMNVNGHAYGQSVTGRSATPTTPGAGVRPPSSLSHVSTPSARLAALRRASDVHGTTNATESIHASIDATDARVGDRVRAMGFEGVLRYLGEVQFKAGEWAGIELGGDHAGKGKNDGSVQGVQYFACPPNCGIFVLATKLEVSMPPPVRPPSSLSSAAGPTPRRATGRPSAAFVAPSTVTREKAKSSTEASKAAAERVTVGSKASSYLNVSSRELQARELSKVPGQESGPTQSTSPRKSIPALGASVMGTTPRATRAVSRPSVGGTFATPGLPRRSLVGAGGPGPNTPTPAVRRPPSSLRARSPDIPSVPPIPANLSMSTTSNASFTGETSFSGLPTPAARRYTGIARPSTPSMARPSSRMSNVSAARSASRASSRASMVSASSHSTRDEPEENGLGNTIGRVNKRSVEELNEANEALTAARRDAEQAKLELLETQMELKDHKKRIRSLQTEVQDLKRQAQSSRLDEASAVDDREADREQYEQRLFQLRTSLETAQSDLAEAVAGRAGLEVETSKTRSELDKLRARQAAHDREKKELANQVDQLRTGGKELLEIYEAKLSAEAAMRMDSDDARRIAEDLAYQLQAELAKVRSAASTAASHDAHSTEALLAASLSAGMQNKQEQESAIAIDNENLRAEVEHLTKRLSTLEEQLYDAQSQIEQGHEDKQRKRHESSETFDKLKKEIADLHTTASDLSEERRQLRSKIAELDEALGENKNTLETERAELEMLRREHSDAPLSNNDFQQIQTELAAAQREAATRADEIADLKVEIASLQEELKLAEEIKEESGPLAGDVDQATGSNSIKRSDSNQLRHHRELDAKNSELQQLRLRIQQYELAAAPSIAESLSSPGLPLSPVHSTAVSGASVSLSPSHATQSSTSPSSSSMTRRKRDSEMSTYSTNTSLSRKSSFQNEATTMRDEINGLKLLLKTTEDERASLASLNSKLIADADAQKSVKASLEVTVDQLARQMGTSAEERNLSKEVAKLRAELKQVERDSKQRISQLEEEVEQMETVMVAKIHREGVLESQLEDTKQALRESRLGAGVNGVAKATEAISTGHNAHTQDGRASVASSRSSRIEPDDDKCEVCGGLHPIEDCPIFGSTESGPSQDNKQSATIQGELYCDDCESREHDLKDCPLASDIW